jgi:hypothetical protein
MMKETKADRILDAVMPPFMLLLIAVVLWFIAVAVLSAFVGDPERAWISDCAKYRPLADCQRDAKTLRVGE